MEKNKIIVHLGGKPVSVVFNEFDKEIDADKLCSVDYGNIYGEAVTIPSLLNAVGILKAYAEKQFAMAKMELDIYESDLKKLVRKNHAAMNQKITENGIEEIVFTDPGFIQKKKEMIEAQFDFSAIDNLWWSVKSKDMKLNNLVKAVTPEELYNELVEGTINNIIIKKEKSIY